jgi:hypothetical protein
MLSLLIYTSIDLGRLTWSDIPLVGTSIALAIIDACTGHAILRATHLSGYDYPIRLSAEIGAIGGAILALPLLAFLHQFSDHVEHRSASLMSRIFAKDELVVLLAIGSATGAASAYVGTLFLNPNWPDTTHAVRTGALGGSIIGTGILVIVFTFYALLHFTRFVRSQNDRDAQAQGKLC